MIGSFVWFATWGDGRSMCSSLLELVLYLVIQLGLLRAFPEPLESFPTLIIAAAVRSHLARVMNPAIRIDIYIIFMVGFMTFE